MPKLSVCIPVYNAEKYIATAIQSVISQTYTDFELIISDNSSTDNTVNVIRKFTDTRIKLLQNKKNIGMYPNFNRCLLASNAIYIKFLNADDFFINKRALELFVNVLDKNPNVGIVSCTAIPVNEKNQFIWAGFSSKIDKNVCKVYHHFLSSVNRTNILEKSPASSLVNVTFLDIGFSFFPDIKINGEKLINIIYRSGTDRFCLSPTHACLRKEIAREIGLFNQSVDSGWGNETEYWSRILLKSDFYKITAPLVAFRRHNSSGSQSVFKNQTQFKDLLINYNLIRKNCSSQLTLSSKAIGRISLNYNIVKYMIEKLITVRNVSTEHIRWALKKDYLFFLISLILFPCLFLAKKFGNDKI
ncbi:MAG: glycosyltransferase family 2 protein [Candidatus Hodarchaeota archaeon]